jgi:hypothetical protein
VNGFCVNQVCSTGEPGNPCQGGNDCVSGMCKNGQCK